MEADIDEVLPIDWSYYYLDVNNNGSLVREYGYYNSGGGDSFNALKGTILEISDIHNGVWYF
jgi:hypothetical protein